MTRHNLQRPCCIPASQYRQSTQANKNLNGDYPMLSYSYPKTVKIGAGSGVNVYVKDLRTKWGSELTTEQLRYDDAFLAVLELVAVGQLSYYQGAEYQVYDDRIVHLR